MNIVGKHGVLSVGGELLAVMPYEIEHVSGGDTTITLKLLHSYNKLNKFNPFVLGVDLAKRNPCQEIKEVIFNAPATIVIWADDTKTVVKCQPDDEYNAELGLAMAISKKFFGNKGNYNEVFKKWLPETNTDVEEFNFEFELSPNSVTGLFDKIITRKRRF